MSITPKQMKSKNKYSKNVLISQRLFGGLRA